MSGSHGQLFASSALHDYRIEVDFGDLEAGQPILRLSRLGHARKRDLQGRGFLPLPLSCQTVLLGKHKSILGAHVKQQRDSHKEGKQAKSPPRPWDRTGQFLCRPAVLIRLPIHHLSKMQKFRVPGRVRWVELGHQVIGELSNCVIW